MSKNNRQIIAYITSDDKRILSGDPLTFLISSEEEMQSLASELGIALRADIMQFKNGDYLVISN